MYKLRFTTGWIRVSDTGSIRNDYLAVQNQQTALASVIIINDAEKYKLLYFNEFPYCTYTTGIWNVYSGNFSNIILFVLLSTPLHSLRVHSYSENIAKN